MSNDATQELLPCPFCGGSNLYIRGQGSPHERMHCDTCFADWRIEYANVRATSQKDEEISNLKAEVARSHQIIRQIGTQLQQQPNPMTYTKIHGICLTPKQLNIVRTFCEPKWGQQDNVWYYGRLWYFADGGSEGRFLGVFA